MADGRGGRRTPPARTPPGGPGRFSRRSERTQPIREPDIDNPDLQYGDRERLSEAQKIARLPGGQTTPPPGTVLPRGTPIRQGGLPPWMFAGPSSFPDEPVSAGLDIGPGPGSEALALQQSPEDIREQTLMYLANFYGNPEAKQDLARLYAERARAAVPAGSPTSISAAAPSVEAAEAPPLEV